MTDLWETQQKFFTEAMVIRLSDATACARRVVSYGWCLDESTWRASCCFHWDQTHSSHWRLMSRPKTSDSVNHLPSLLLEPAARVHEILDVTIGFKDVLRRLQTLTFPPTAFWEIWLKGGERGGRNSCSIFQWSPIKAGFTSEAL